MGGYRNAVTTSTQPALSTESGGGDFEIEVVIWEADCWATEFRGCFHRDAAVLPGVFIRS
mgnify:CR=1 FL=1